MPSRPPTALPREAAFCAAVKSVGLLITAAAAFMASFSAVVPDCSVCWWRSSTSIEGMSIFTGQASKQAPQRLEAYGRELLGSFFAACIPASCGVRTAPIGPGYVDPYAWPPARSYTGQTLRQAEQRMQLSASRPIASASAAVRPLSRRTRWKSCGPSPGVTPVHMEVYGFIRSPVEDRGSNWRNTSRS